MIIFYIAPIVFGLIMALAFWKHYKATAATGLVLFLTMVLAFSTVTPDPEFGVMILMGFNFLSFTIGGPIILVVWLIELKRKKSTQELVPTRKTPTE